MTKAERWIFWSTGVGTLMSGMNTSSISTVLPAMAHDLSVSLNSVQWMVTVYTLMLSVLLLPMGRLGDAIGHRRVYFGGLGIFVVFSVATGMLTTLGWMLAARALQAVGGAMIMASVPALLTSIFPPKERGKILGLYAMNVYVGLSLGPVVGGVLASWQGWPAIFFLNVPLFGVAVLMGRLPAAAPAERRQPTAFRFDYRGAAIFLAAVSLFLVSINQGFAAGWQWQWLLLLAVSIVLSVVLVRVEHRVPEPMLAFSLLSERALALNVGATFLNYACTFFYFFLLPVYLVTQLGMPESRAGLIITATPLVMIVVSNLSGRMSDRIGVRLPTTAGMLVLAGGLAVLGIFHVTALSALIATFMVIGVGMGLFTAPNNSAVMGRVPRTMQGMASGIVGTARYSGQALGITFASALYEGLLGKGHALAAFQHTILIGAGLAAVGAGFSFWAGAAPARSPARPA